MNHGMLLKAKKNSQAGHAQAGHGAALLTSSQASLGNGWVELIIRQGMRSIWCAPRSLSELSSKE